MQQLDRVNAAHFADAERESAVGFAVRFVNAFRRLGIDFPEIVLQDPCGMCIRDEYKISLGDISVEHAEAIAGRINRIASKIEFYDRKREGSPAPEPAVS